MFSPARSIKYREVGLLAISSGLWLLHVLIQRAQESKDANLPRQLRARRKERADLVTRIPAVALPTMHVSQWSVRSQACPIHSQQLVTGTWLILRLFAWSCFLRR